MRQFVTHVDFVLISTLQPFVDTNPTQGQAYIHCITKLSIHATSAPCDITRAAVGVICNQSKSQAV